MERITDDVEQRVAQAKAFLMNAEADGRSVYDHLRDVVATMIEENPNDIAGNPEKIAQFSRMVKEQVFNYGEASGPQSSSSRAPTVHAAVAQQAEVDLALLAKEAPKETKTVVERPNPLTIVTTTKVTPSSTPAFSSVARQNQFWRAAGAGIPDAEARLMDQAIGALAADKKLKEVRFFGKIFGTHADYTVVTSQRHVEEGEVPMTEINTMPNKPPRKKLSVDVQPEPAYKGCNRYSFWVSAGPGSAWVKLPDVTPQQLNAARKVRKFFTGDLNAPVISYPAFPWNEAVLLRAQLSRLLSATYVAPSGAVENWEPAEDEEDEDDQLDEDELLRKARPAKYKPQTQVVKDYAVPDENIRSMLDLEQWVHADSYIYETGRQTKVPPKPEPEEPPQDEEEEEDQDDDALNNNEEEEEEKDLFGPVRRDTLFSVIKIPKEPSPEDDEEEDELDEDEDPDAPLLDDEGNPVDTNAAEKPKEDDDVPDDDPLQKKIFPWLTKCTNMTYKKHGIALLKSVRWPGALAYAGQGGKQWGCVYFGDGIKASDTNFSPVLAPPICGEAKDLTEAADPTAANEKLVLRGEDPKEADSEDDREDEPEDEEGMEE